MAFSKTLKPGQPLKVCLVSGTVPPLRCGVGDYTIKLAQALVSQTRIKFELSILTAEQVQTTESYQTAKFKLVNMVSRWDWANLRRILAYFAATQFDIIHFQYPTTLYGRHPAITLLPSLLRLQALIKRSKSPRCILTIHEYATFRLAGKIRIWLMALGCQSVICVSQATVQSLRPLRRLGKQLLYIPLGSNISNELPADYEENPLQWRQAHGLPIGTPIVAYFGFISPSKGLPDLIEAFANLKAEAWLLLIAEPKAQDDNYRSYFDKLKQLIKSRNLEAKVSWTGFVSETEVSAYLRQATVAVFPFIDGVSLRRTSIIAALINRVAVISTIPTNSYEAGSLVAGQNIWLVPPKSPIALGEAIEKLLSDNSLQAKLAENGQKLAAGLSWQTIAQQHLNSYFGQLSVSE